ncbi:MAG: hypothetical protein ACTS73_04355 [Arsenophonus sp. NEOnobi-MAG3]
MRFNKWPWLYWAEKFPADIALITENRQYSWRQLAIKINGCCRQSLPLVTCSPADECNANGKYSLSMVLYQLALLQLSARVLPINPQLPESKVAKLTARLPIDCVIDFTKQPLSLPNVKLLDYHALMVKLLNYQDDITSAVPFMPLLQAILILTLGSIGLAKAVVHNITAHLNSAKGVFFH